MGQSLEGRNSAKEPGHPGDTASGVSAKTEGLGEEQTYLGERKAPRKRHRALHLEPNHLPL